MPSWLRVFRFLALAFAILGAIVAVAVNAHVRSLANVPNAPILTFELLVILAGILTLPPVTMMLVVDLVRTGALTSKIAFELVWLSILWIMWAVAGAFVVDQALVDKDDLRSVCDFTQIPIFAEVCSDVRAIAAFAFLVSVALFAYTGTLLVVASRSRARGMSVWTSSVKQLSAGVLLPAHASDPGLIPMLQPGSERAYNIEANLPSPPMPVPMHPNHHQRPNHGMGGPGPMSLSAMSVVYSNERGTAGRYGDAGAAYRGEGGVAIPQL
ncbi:hypothetical protein C2E23DRAFT_885285 [Lenzites betulinus]|nr:hypothetical protein C2E23DRAFT_885285 [Lenzites betulinus]